MNYELLTAELWLSPGISNTQAHWDYMMGERLRRTTFAGTRKVDHRGPLPPENSLKSPIMGYFSIESILVFVCVTASLLILPLILPPLPPPPLSLLLLPLGMIGVLLILAFMPSDLRNVASSYL